MKLLILGGSGMLGHQLWRHFAAAHDTWVTLRQDPAPLLGQGLFAPGRIRQLDAMDAGAVADCVREVQPDAVLNCIGVIKQLKEARDPIPSLTLNALLPHHLARVCRDVGARLVLFSTDCVFSGRRGNYRETDVPDAEDLYGRTKLLGEVTDQTHVVTLRTSIVGRELGTAHSLVDWFLSQRGGRVRGFRRAIYSGFTTLEMARIVELLLTERRELHGLWQVASTPITKYDLLLRLREAFRVPVEIDPFDEFACDRSLDGTRFQEATGYQAPSWEAMMAELASTPA